MLQAVKICTSMSVNELTAESISIRQVIRETLLLMINFKTNEALTDTQILHTGIHTDMAKEDLTNTLPAQKSLQIGKILGSLKRITM
jgi:hypothetical protein